MCMDGDITFYKINGTVVRVIMRDNQPWWIARDVCSALGCSNSREILQEYLEEDDWCVINLDVLGCSMDMRIVSFVGLCTLLLFFTVANRQYVMQEILLVILSYLHQTTN